MFSQFKTDDGDLIIRAVDIRWFSDIATDRCTLAWEPVTGELTSRTIHGTAEENFNRLQQEETDTLIAAEKLRQRQAGGYPPDPIQRGKQSMRMVKP